MSHPAASGLHDTCCHQNKNKNIRVCAFLLAFHPNSGRTTPSVLWVSHSSSVQYFIETLCDKLFERESHGSDKVHEPHLNPNPWSAIWPAETSRQPENALLKHETKAASICPPLLGTEPTWRGLIGLDVFQLPLCYWCWPLCQQPHNAWYGMRECFHLAVNEGLSGKSESVFCFVAVGHRHT